jgi:aldose 1-epimerase
MRLMYNGKELDEILGPKFKTVLLWSTPLAAAAGGGGRGGPPRNQAPPTPSGPYPVDAAKGVRTAPPAEPMAAGAPAPTAKGFIAFEPMAAITDALNLSEKGVYKDLQMIPPGGSWEESFWITTKGY